MSLDTLSISSCQIDLCLQENLHQDKEFFCVQIKTGYKFI